MSNNNPKSFYNQTDYSPGGSSTIHKPDEITSAKLQPPPPYSPEPSRQSADSARYGGTDDDLDQPQRLGLLSQQPQRFDSAKNTPRWAMEEQNNSSNSNPHQELENQSIPSWNTRTRPNGDPGCCRSWCKYIFVALLICIVITSYSHKIGFSSPKFHSPERVSCGDNTYPWKKMPRTINFQKNVQLTVEGHVCDGVVVVTPLEDRDGGSIITDIKFTPSNLGDKLSYAVEDHDDTTRLTLKMPSHLSLEKEECINMNVEIRLPYSADFMLIDVTNVDVRVRPFVKDVEYVEIRTANGNVELDRWSGESIKLITKNGKVKTGLLNAGEYVFIQNSNGHVIVTEDVIAKKQVDIFTTNGKIDSLGSIKADDVVGVRTSNGAIHLEKLYANRVYVDNSNDQIQVNAVEAKEEVVIKSSNGPINLTVDGEKNISVAVSTSNDRINLHMTNEFEGHFILDTSNGKVNIENEDYIDYQDNSRSLKTGNRKGSSNKGDLSVTNSNSDIIVSFDI